MAKGKSADWKSVITLLFHVSKSNPKCATGCSIGFASLDFAALAATGLLATCVGTGVAAGLEAEIRADACSGLVLDAACGLPLCSAGLPRSGNVSTATIIQTMAVMLKIAKPAKWRTKNPLPFAPSFLATLSQANAAITNTIKNIKTSMLLPLFKTLKNHVIWRDPISAFFSALFITGITFPVYVPKYLSS